MRAADYRRSAGFADCCYGNGDRLVCFIDGKSRRILLIDMFWGGRLAKIMAQLSMITFDEEVARLNPVNLVDNVMRILVHELIRSIDDLIQS